jgi:hypothetical protein
MKQAEEGSTQMAIWLGKQMLGQRDVTPVELSGPNGNAVQFSLEVINEILSEKKKK